MKFLEIGGPLKRRATLEFQYLHFIRIIDMQTDKQRQGFGTVLSILSSGLNCATNAPW